MAWTNFKTLTYADDVQGWPSFYSFGAEFMIGMNGYFYTFSHGQLYRHNVNDNRNEYYGVDGSLAPSTITGVLNIEPKTIKLFKTMSYESDAAWACTSLFTDLGTGSMLSTFFVQKEGEWFTFIRETEGTRDYRDRNVNGIGVCANVAGPAAAVQITFTLEVGSIVSIGDYIYDSTYTAPVPPATNATIGAPVYSGQVTAIDRVNNIITIDTTVPEPGTGAAGASPAIGGYIFYFKDVVAESHGARGYFMQFTLSNNNTTSVELFAVGGSVMKSFP